MAYLTQSEIEAHTGYTYTDFKQAGSAMSSAQWTSYLTGILIPAVQAEINHFCSRGSFEVTSYTDYFNGKGMSGLRGRMYREQDRVFIPKEQPVVSVTSVSENTGYPSDAITWTARTVQSTSVGGDFALIVRNNLTRIRFHSEIPKLGIGNVKIVYTAGYTTDSATFLGIKAIALEMVANYLARKKRDQETIAARRVSTQDSANMFQEKRPELMTEEIQLMLQPYRRIRGRWV